MRKFKAFLQKHFSFLQPFFLGIALIVLAFIVDNFFPVNGYVIVGVVSFLVILLVYFATEAFTKSKMPWEDKLDE